MERHFQDGTEPTILPHYARCTGPCDQGRKPELCLSSCRKASRDEALELEGLVWRTLALAMLAVALAASIGLTFGLIFGGGPTR